MNDRSSTAQGQDLAGGPTHIGPLLEVRFFETAPGASPVRRPATQARPTDIGFVRSRSAEPPIAFATLTTPEPLSQPDRIDLDWGRARAVAPLRAHAAGRERGLNHQSAEDETRVYDDAPGSSVRSFLAPRSTRRGTGAFVIDTAEQVRVMGVVFRCGAAAAFFRERMDTIANAHRRSR